MVGLFENYVWRTTSGMLRKCLTKQHKTRLIIHKIAIPQSENSSILYYYLTMAYSSRIVKIISSLGGIAIHNKQECEMLQR
jgi:hypothetical protein